MPTDHCESCGQESPQTKDGDGYTCCCNELVCWGDEKHKFGIPDDFVVACCWAKAEAKFKAKDKEVPEGSCRLD